MADDIVSYKVCVVLLASLNIFLLIPLSITIHYYTNEDNGSLPADVDKVCLPCANVRLHPDESFQHYKVTQNGTLCCIEDIAHIYQLINNTAANWFKRKLNSENPQFTSCKKDVRILPVIKVVGIPHPQGGQKRTIVDWDDTADLAHINGPIDFKDGQILIRETGLYTVYSQVMFQHDQASVESSQKDAPTIYEHIVSVHPFGSYDTFEQLILKSSHSDGQCHVPRHNISSFVATTFQLAKGDKVSVKVNDLSYMLPSAHLNFFGVHMM